jgi:hypothetical protein
MTDDLILLPSARTAAVAAEAFRRWPKLFDTSTTFHNPKPLALRTGEQMWAAFSRSKGPNLQMLTINQIVEALDVFLDNWVSDPLYLCRCAMGGPRYNLNGEVWGEVTEDEAAWAGPNSGLSCMPSSPMGHPTPRRRTAGRWRPGSRAVGEKAQRRGALRPPGWLLGLGQYLRASKRRWAVLGGCFFGRLPQPRGLRRAGQRPRRVALGEFGAGRGRFRIWA